MVEGHADRLRLVPPQHGMPLAGLDVPDVNVVLARDRQHSGIGRPDGFVNARGVNQAAHDGGRLQADDVHGVACVAEGKQLVPLRGEDGAGGRRTDRNGPQAVTRGQIVKVDQSIGPADGSLAAVRTEVDRDAWPIHEIPEHHDRCQENDFTALQVPDVTLGFAVADVILRQVSAIGAKQGMLCEASRAWEGE